MNSIVSDFYSKNPFWAFLRDLSHGNHVDSTLCNVAIQHI